MSTQTVKPDNLKMNRPLYVFVSRSQEAIYASWHRQLITLITVFVLFSVVAVAGLKLLQRRQLVLEQEAQQTEKLRNLRSLFIDYGESHDLQSLLQYILDQVCSITDSPVGFFHFVEPDQKTLTLQAWSTRTLTEYCSAEGGGLHYPVEMAGVWADAVRECRAIIHNDYASLPNRKGLPKGHAPVIRELVVPIIRADKVVGILGIGNKPELYSEQDLALTSYLADVAWEITDRKRIEQDRQETQQRLADIFEFLPDATLVVDQDKKVLAWNKAMEQLSGITKAEILGQGDYAYTVPFYGDRRKNLIDLLDLDDAELKEQYTHVTRNGDALFAESFCPALYSGKGAHIWAIVAPLYDTTGKRVGAIESIRDISSIKEAEENLARSNRELEQFAYVASHDLQEPLRKIAGFTELLASRYKEMFDEKAESYMGYIVDGATRMRVLINDLLSYSRVMRSTRALEEVDSAVLVSKVLRDMEVTIKENQAEIQCGELPSVWVDQTQLSQLFQNLIGNAIKYHGVAAPRIAINAIQEKNEWIFSVSDNGIGIAPEFYERIFVIFQRLHTKTEYPGTGIGLAVCQKIVERHGGKIWLESNEGSGSTFFFSLPVAQAHKENAV